MINQSDPMGLFSDPETFEKKNDEALRNIFGKKYIKGNFLITMKHRVMKTNPEIYNYYDLSISRERILSGSTPIDFDICKTIVGCHLSNIIFLSDEERAAREKSEDYKNELVNNVIQNIKLRPYGSSHFRNLPLMDGELFLVHNLPYDLFVMAMRMNELINDSHKDNKFLSLYSSISTKSLAALSLLGDNFLGSCYPICRAIIELYLKLILLRDNPDLLDEHFMFSNFEIRQSCCEQEYPDEFNKLYNERINKSKTSKSDYLHYGWVDKIEHYHDVVKQKPYSVYGVLKFLKKTHEKGETQCFDTLAHFYKLCNGFTHGSVSGAKYPLLHYFEVSIMLYMTLKNSYIFLCKDLGVDAKINGIDIIAKAEKDFTLLNEQYSQRSTELFERHYGNIKQ